MWIIPLRSNPLGRALFCFPYAGGSAAVFRSWQRSLVDVDVRAVHLPGRGARLREEPHRRLRDLAAAACDGLRGELDRPFALFGHSFGSLVAFEVTRELRRRRLPMPVHLFLSARRGPRRPDPAPPMHGLSDVRLLEEVRVRYGGIPDEVLNEPELLALLLPTLRADLEALETYSCEPEPPLPVPLTVLGGLDDPWATLPDLEAWREETVGPFAVKQFPGGHFYLDVSGPLLLSELGVRLDHASGLTAGVGAPA